jgi:hypothetical protein
MSGGVWSDATLVFGPSFSNWVRQAGPFVLFANLPSQELSPSTFTVHNWLYSANPGDLFISHWAKLLELHWSQHGQRHYFDAFFCATALIRSGLLPCSTIADEESLGLLESSTTLMSGLLSRRALENQRKVFQSAPFHKLSHKLRQSEALELMSVLEDISSGQD